MSGCRTRSLLMVLTSLFLGGIALAVPPPPPRNMPGTAAGTATTRWLGPYVSVTGRNVGATNDAAVTWFAPDGSIRRELKLSPGSADRALVYRYQDKGQTVYAVNADWEVTLPQKPGPWGYVTASVDGRVLVHQFHPQDGQSAVDIYLNGKLANTLGPFVQYSLDEVSIGDDGSIAMLTWKDERKQTSQLIVVGPDGKEHFRVDCQGPVTNVRPAPDGSAALAQCNDGGNVFALYTKAGKVASLDVGPNARLGAWLPGTTSAFMESSVGNDRAWHLIDWTRGARLWQARDPNAARVAWSSCPTVVLKDHVLVGGLEYVSYEQQKVPVRSLYALKISDGKTAAHWLPDPLHQASCDAGEFVRLGERLFLVTDAAFCEISTADISNHTNGWR